MSVASAVVAQVVVSDSTGVGTVPCALRLSAAFIDDPRDATAAPAQTPPHSEYLPVNTEISSFVKHADAY